MNEAVDLPRLLPPRCESMTSEIQVCHLSDGYWQVPAGKLANATVWMEMRRPVVTDAAPNLALKRVPPINTAELRSVFNRIGAASLWDRTAQLNRDVHSSPWTADDFLYYAFDETERHVGLVELARRGEATTTELEISYFGLFPEFIGQGLGRALMAATLIRAAEFAPHRIVLHTCNTDHPSAFAFYRATGFVPYAAGLQIMDDPRAHGWLPVEAAPHVPFIDI